MRRILVAALAALCLVAAGAEARVAVISVPHVNEFSANATGRGDLQTMRNRSFQYIMAFLYAHAAPESIDVIPANQVQTTLIRFGKVTGWNSNLPYTAVIWNGFGTALSTNPTKGCYPCSLTITGMLPTVPQLFIGTSVGEIEFSPSTSCSIGVGDCQDPTTQGPGYSGQRVHLAGSKDAIGWIIGTQGSTMLAERDSGTTAWAQMGLRPIMGASSSNVSASADPPFDENRAASKRQAWRDSIYSTEYENRAAGVNGKFAQFSDIYGMYIFDRLNTYKADTTFAPTVYAHWAATAVPTTGGSSATTDSRVDGNPFVIWAAIAHLDSISSFGVLGRSPKSRSIAFQVSGGLSRGAWNSPGGLRPSDPNFAKGVDSLASLNIPFAVGVPANASDSLATYASDLTTWSRASLARFAVSATLGTKDTIVVGAGNATTTKAFDLFGRFRNRLFYTGLTTDSSVYSLLVASRARLDSILAANSIRNRIDNMLIAGQDDWSPKNWTFPANCRDSLASVALLAGFTGIACNPEEDSLDVVTPTNTRGGYPDVQQHARGSIGNSAGARFLFACFPGYNPRGAVFGNGGESVGGASTIISDSSWCAIYAHRSIRGLYLPYWMIDPKWDWVFNTSRANMAAVWYSEPITSYASRSATLATGTNLVRITASSIGYGGDGPSPDMPGFYQVKYTVNMCRAINKLAGRTLIRIVYPDELTVEDIKR